jgi:hypothetical protein
MKTLLSILTNAFSSEAMAKKFPGLLENSHDNLYDRRAS